MKFENKAKLAIAATLTVFSVLWLTHGMAFANPEQLKPLAVDTMRKFIVHEAPKPASGVTFTDAAGKAVDLSTFKGKVVLVNLWATWCVPCRAEMPALDRLQQKLGSADFEVLALAQERDATKAQAFLTEIGAKSLKLYLDPSLKSARSFGAVGLPTTLLLDHQGREIGRLLGEAAWDSEQAVKLIEAVKIKN